MSLFTGVKAIIFDLDGTLYVSSCMAQEIINSADSYIASLLGIDETGARLLIEDTRKRLSAESGRQATLSSVCVELGGDMRQLHDHFAAEIKPESCLERDDSLAKLLAVLAERVELYVYTNNNRFVCDKILKVLGISDFFTENFTIENSWRPKPDLIAMEKIYARVGRSPAECLFIGDRYDVDLRLPASLGSPVLLVGSVQELMDGLQKIVDEWAGENALR